MYFCFSHNDREKNGKALPNRVRNYFSAAAAAAALSISLNISHESLARGIFNLRTDCLPTTNVVLDDNRRGKSPFKIRLK